MAHLPSVLDIVTSNLLSLSKLQDNQTFRTIDLKLEYEDRHDMLGIRRSMSGDSSDRILKVINVTMNLWEELLSSYDASTYKNNSDSGTYARMREGLEQLLKLSETAQVSMKKKLTNFYRYSHDQNFQKGMDSNISKFKNLTVRTNDVLMSMLERSGSILASIRAKNPSIAPWSSPVTPSMRPINPPIIDLLQKSDQNYLHAEERELP
jgi:hypothetical protein